MTARLPCAEGNQDDWFISKDGKQYASDDLLNDDHALEILESANELGLRGDERIAFIEAAQDAAEVVQKRDNLRARRHAKEACLSCLVRTECLTIALDNDEQHGTWGGYYEEELRAIRLEIARRKRARTKAGTE